MTHPTPDANTLSRGGQGCRACNRLAERYRARSLLKALGLLGRRVKPVAKSSLNHALFLNENGHANNRAAAESAK
jgi:hypothetical protein